jgi:3'-phosphoadenosine 5'-phosphosulfate sulfotransferase (PAPS reductase)/FAD synthetase
MTAEMISFGAGVNSVAMTIMLVNDGWRGPIMFADTGGEHPETYCYLEYFAYWLLRRGLAITILSPGSAWHGKDAQIELEPYCQSYAIIPLLSVRWCSVKWKRDPVQAWATMHGYDTQLLGICASEPRRIRNDPAVRYPLYEQDITRAECTRIIQHEGLDLPIKSGCFFCPGQNLAEWRRLFYDHPDLYERAALLEDRASEKHGKHATLDSHGISLREHARRRWEGQIEMDLSAWLPCACSL